MSYCPKVRPEFSLFYDNNKSKAYFMLIFTKYTRVPRHYMQTSCSKIHPNRKLMREYRLEFIYDPKSNGFESEDF